MACYHPPLISDLEAQNESSPLLSQNRKKQKEQKQNKTQNYKNSSSQTEVSGDLSEEVLKNILNQLEEYSITFINKKTEQVETRLKTRSNYDSWLGDTKHRLACQIHIGELNDQELQRYVSAKAQTEYLRNHHPEAIPPNNSNGTPPSEHTISTVFEYLYHRQPGFAAKYLQDVFPNLYL
jgi:hypothetical protein